MTLCRARAAYKRTTLLRRWKWFSSHAICSRGTTNDQKQDNHQATHKRLPNKNCAMSNVISRPQIYTNLRINVSIFYSITSTLINDDQSRADCIILCRNVSWTTRQRLLIVRHPWSQWCLYLAISFYRRFMIAFSDVFVYVFTSTYASKRRTWTKLTI